MIEDCLKVTSYFGERERIDGALFSDVLLGVFEQSAVTTSILLRASGGFGLRHHLRGDQTLTMSEDPSVAAIAIDTHDRIAPMLPRLAGMQQTGMLTVERARLVLDALRNRSRSRPAERSHEADHLPRPARADLRAPRPPCRL